MTYFPLILLPIHSFLLPNSHSDAHIHFHFSSLSFHCFLNLLSFSTPYSNSLHSVLLLSHWLFLFHSFSQDICLIHCVLSHLGAFSFPCFSQTRSLTSWLVTLGSNPDKQHKQFTHHILCLSYFIYEMRRTYLIPFLK